MRSLAKPHGRLWLGLVCTVSFLAAFPVSISHGVQETQPAPPCSHSAGRAAGLQYRLSEFGRCAERRPLPMVISLHGMGDRPRELFDELPLPVRVVSPQAPRPYGSGYSWFSHSASEVSGRVLAPQIRTMAKQVAAMIVELKKTFPTLGQPVVTGVSQGGMLAFALALYHQDVVGEAFPVAGWLPRQLWSRRLVQRAVTTHAMHGAQDVIIPLAPTAQMVSTLAGRGHPVQLETYADAGHDMTKEMHARRYLQLMRVLRNK